MTKRIRTTRTATPVPQPPARILTRAERATRALEIARNQATWNAEAARKDLAAFREKLDADPCSAFEWSRQAFEAAGRLRAAQTVTEIIEAAEEETRCEYGPPSALMILRRLRAYFYQEVRDKARYPSRSTSPQSNEMVLTLASHFADWLDNFDRNLEYVEAVD